MRQEHIEAGRVIAAELLDLEAQIDATIASGGRFPATMVEARLKAKLPAATGQEALLHAAKAFELLIQARKHVVQAHASLATAAGDLGLVTTAFGDQSPCPDAEMGALDQPREPALRLAAAQ
jgi:hypothetical protein